MTLHLYADKVWQEMKRDHSGEWGMDINKWDWVPGVGVISMLEYYEATHKPEILAFLLAWVMQNKNQTEGKMVINSIAPYAIFR